MQQRTKHCHVHCCRLINVAQHALHTLYTLLTILWMFQSSLHVRQSQQRFDLLPWGGLPVIIVRHACIAPFCGTLGFKVSFPRCCLVGMLLVLVSDFFASSAAIGLWICPCLFGLAYRPTSMLPTYATYMVPNLMALSGGSSLIVAVVITLPLHPVVYPVFTVTHMQLLARQYCKVSATLHIWKHLHRYELLPWSHLIPYLICHAC